MISNYCVHILMRYNTYAVLPFEKYTKVFFIFFLFFIYKPIMKGIFQKAVSYFGKFQGPRFHLK